MRNSAGWPRPGWRNNRPDRPCRQPHEALDALAVEDQLAAEIVKLRYFVGLSIAEIAGALALAPRTVDRHWAFARAWLERAIKGALSR